MKNIKLIILILLIFTLTNGLSQKNFAATKAEHRMIIPHTPSVTSLNFNYGSQKIDLKGLSSYLIVNDYENYLEYWGFGINTLKNRRYYGLSFHYFNNHNRDFNDSVKTTLDGLSFNLSFGYDLVESSKIDVIPMIGLGYQALELKVKQGYISTSLAGINHVNYLLTNNAFIIDLGIEVRIPVHRKVAFSFKGGYKFDLSNTNWKHYDNEDKLNANSYIGGAYIQASLCIGGFLKRKRMF